MGVSQPRNIGAHIKCVPGIRPSAATGNVAAGSTNAPYYDRQADNFPLSMAVQVQHGAWGGGADPSAVTTTAKVKHSADHSTWVDYIPPGKSTVAEVEVSGQNASAELDVDLSGADRYIALDTTPVFTGGTTPSIELSGTLAVGGASVEPL